MGPELNTGGWLLCKGGGGRGLVQSIPTHGVGVPPPPPGISRDPSTHPPNPPPQDGGDTDFEKKHIGVVAHKRGDKAGGRRPSFSAIGGRGQDLGPIGQADVPEESCAPGGGPLGGGGGEEVGKQDGARIGFWALGVLIWNLPKMTVTDDFKKNALWNDVSPSCGVRATILAYLNRCSVGPGPICRFEEGRGVKWTNRQSLATTH